MLLHCNIMHLNNLDSGYFYCLWENNCILDASRSHNSLSGWQSLEAWSKSSKAQSPAQNHSGRLDTIARRSWLGCWGCVDSGMSNKLSSSFLSTGYQTTTCIMSLLVVCSWKNICDFVINFCRYFAQTFGMLKQKSVVIFRKVCLADLSCCGYYELFELNFISNIIWYFNLSHVNVWFCFSLSLVWRFDVS